VHKDVIIHVTRISKSTLVDIALAVMKKKVKWSTGEEIKIRYYEFLNPEGSYQLPYDKSGQYFFAYNSITLLTSDKLTE
jgi:hypothetical protein